MAKKVQKKKTKAKTQSQEVRPKDFLDLIAPSAVKFNTDHYICGSMYHCTLALRSYPATTEELALLRHLGEKSGVTLSVYTRQVTAAEENGILHNAENKNRMARSSTNSMKAAVTAEGNLQDVAELIAAMRKNREPLIHCAVYFDLAARDPESLRRLREEVTTELVRSKLGTDQLLLRQQDGFLSSNPMGRSTFKSQYERVLPASSVANLYPFNYSGKTDPRGFYIGRDRYGSNIIVDLDRRAEDKTTASALILGNTGQGKSYLLKLLLCNVLEAGKAALSLDSEHEMEDLCSAVGGCFLDLLSGQYRINLDEEGNEVEEVETYQIPHLVDDLAQVYERIGSTMGVEITADHQANADNIYNLVVYGSPDGAGGGWFAGADVPFIGADGFCSPIGAGWESVVTSEFGNRIDPFTGQRRGHTGMDLAVPTGTPIRAALPGTVTVSQYNSSYGYYVMIDHGNGLSTLYGHNSHLLAQVGQTVEAGDIIARSGSTGRSTGPHLHFEVRVNGERTNPRYYLPTTGG